MSLLILSPLPVGQRRGGPVGESTKQHEPGEFNAWTGFGWAGDLGRPPREVYHVPWS